MIPEITAAFGAAISLAERLAAAHSAAERNRLLIEFQKAVISAQGITMSLQAQQSSLVTRNQELEQEVVRLKDWSTEREKYSLRQVARGVFCQVEKTEVGDGAKLHKYCATCFENGRKSILQHERIEIGRQSALNCFVCKERVVFTHYAE